MAVYFTQKFGFLTCAELLYSIDQELTSTKGNGKKYFTRKYAKVGPTVYTSNTVNLSMTSGDFLDNTEKTLIYEATADCDPLFNYQVPGSNANSTWRIMFKEWMQRPETNSGSSSPTGNITAGVSVTVGTNIQLPDNGLYALLNNREQPPNNNSITGTNPFGVSIMPPGTLGDVWAKYGVPNSTTQIVGAPNTIDVAQFDDLWLNRIVTNTYGNQKEGENHQRAYPMSYMISMSNRGLYLGIWEDSQEEIPQWNFETAANDDSELAEGLGRSPFRWFLIQRGVDRITGHVRGGQPMRDDVDPATEESRCPVYVVGGTTRAKQFFKFIARELDVVSPSKVKFAAVDMEDSPSCLNPWPQNSISESGEFVVNFINNLSTPRFRYADELDMVGTVGAEVIGAGTIIEVNVYNETSPRKYIAAYATNKFGTGMRLMVLMEAGEDDEDSHIFKKPETYALTANVSSVSENGSVLFTLNTTNVSNNKKFYYHITDLTGNVTSNISRYDFTDSTINGVLTITNNTASVVKTISSAVSFPGTANVKMVVRKLSNQVGNIIASTGNITIANI